MGWDGSIGVSRFGGARFGCGRALQKRSIKYTIWYIIRTDGIISTGREKCDMALIDTVRKTIRDHDLIHTGDHIVLGLSGGPDSVCLFHVLQRLAAELDLTIRPVHINHQFRPGDAERDQAYVEELCGKVAAGSAGRVYPCRSFVVDVNAMARELGMTSEEAGRKARYDAFAEVAGEAAREAAGEERQ